MDFTGERLIPDQQRDDDLYYEHAVRYLFAAQLAPGRAVLDAGCGAGYGSALLAWAGAQSVLGVDIAPEAIAYARHHYTAPGLSYAVQDVAHLDPAQGSRDLVVSFEVIEHLDDPAALVRSVARVLAPGGVFVVSTPNPATYPAGNPYHKYEMSLAEFDATLRQSFPALVLFEEDYTTAIAVRPAARGDAAPTLADDGRLIAAQERQPAEPDYYLALCALRQETLDAALVQVQGVTCELPADRLGERIADLLAVQGMLEEKNRCLADKNVYIARLEADLKRQGAWAAGLEQQVRDLNNAWPVRLWRRLR